MFTVVIPISFVVANANSWLLHVVGNIVIDIAEQVTTVLSLVIYLSLLRTAKRAPSILSFKN